MAQTGLESAPSFHFLSAGRETPHLAKESIFRDDTVVSVKPASVLVLVLKLMCGCARWITFLFVKKHHRTFFVLFGFREVCPPDFSVSTLLG